MRWSLGWVLVVLVGLTAPAYGQAPTLRFEHLGQDQGLSESTVETIVEDHKGFMWFGTYDGLNRYDGNTFTIYRNNPQDPRSLSGNRIERNNLLEDREGTLWIGTNNGLNRYDRDTDTFQGYKRDEQDPSSLSSNVVYAVYEDRDGDLWVGTSNGLNRFDRVTESFVRYLPDGQEPARGRSAPLVFAIVEDGQGYLWIGTQGGGLNCLDPETGSFVDCLHDSNDPSSLSNNTVRALWEDRDGTEACLPKL